MKYVLTLFSLTVFALAAIFGQAADKSANSDCGANCALNKVSNKLSINGLPKSSLSADESKIVAYIVDQVVKNGATNFESDEIEKATGISMAGMDELKLRNAALAELGQQECDLAGSNCTTFSACSIDGMLNGTAGVELIRYKEEKAEDGKYYKDWTAPGFTLPTTTGSEVSLADFEGQPLALIFLAGHCYHSHQTLAELSDLMKEYESEGLAILPVMVNSGSVETVKNLIARYDTDFPVAVSEGGEISEAYESRMVPTTFLIDGKGMITRKFVGYKSGIELGGAISDFLGKDSVAENTSRAFQNTRPSTL